VLSARNFVLRRGGAAAAALALLVILGLNGCGDDNSTNPPPEFAAPENLTVINGDQAITVEWDASADEADTDFRRYNIYRGTSSLLGVDAGDLEQLGYKVGSATAANRSFTTTVANGTLYYFHVRGEKDDGTLSHPTDEMRGAGRLEGEGKIIEEFVSDGDSGFDFSEGATVSLRQDNPDRFTFTDIYLGTGDANDDAGSPLSLKSPSLLDRINNEWSSKVASIKFLGTDWSTNTTTETAMEDQINVIVGAIYVIKTPLGNFAKLHVQSIDGDAGSRTITFRYAYQPTPNLIQF
jgi:hypothetical protein